MDLFYHPFFGLPESRQVESKPVFRRRAIKRIDIRHDEYCSALSEAVL